MLPGGDIAEIGFVVGGDQQRTKEQSPFCSAYFLANYTTARAYALGYPQNQIPKLVTPTTQPIDLGLKLCLCLSPGYRTVDPNPYPL